MSDKPTQPNKEPRCRTFERLYYAFANSRSAALETARLMLEQCGDQTPKDVLRFLETQQKPAKTRA